MVNYDNDLKFLFEPASTVTEKPYQVDSIFMDFSTESGFNNRISMVEFFKNISSVQIKSQSPDKVKTYLNTPCTATPASSCLPEKTSTFTAASMDNDIFLEVSFGSAIAGADYRSILDGLQNNKTSGNTTEVISKDHKLMKTYVKDGIEDIVRYRFRNLIRSLATVGQDLLSNASLANDSRQFLLDPLMRIASLRDTQQTLLLGILRESCLKAFRGYFDTTSGAINSAEILTFKDGRFDDKIYYNIRNRMVSNINVSTIYTSINTDDVWYFKKMAVDIFLKSCFPIVHMVYMDALVEKYALAGDYINVRIIILAQIFYLYFLIKYVGTTLDTFMPATFKMNTTQRASMSEVIEVLKNYIINNNNIDPKSNSTSSNDDVRKMVIELHKMSNDVSGQNKNIQHTSEQIKENQVTMRNIIFNIDVKRKEFRKANREYMFALILVILVTIVNVALLLMGLPDYVFYISGFVGVAVILYLMIMIIINFVKGKM